VGKISVTPPSVTIIDKEVNMSTQKNIKTPEILYQHFEAYKKQCKKSPKKENFWSTKLDKQISVDREIPYTWNGFEIWLRKNGIIVRLDDYKADKGGRYTDYADIIHTIDAIIYEDKVTGATAGIFQHNIIARELGLTDKKDITSKGEKLEAVKVQIDTMIDELES